MDSVNDQATGSITLKLYKGSVRAVARSSPNALYDPALAGFGESGGLLSQQASPGFIELRSLQSRMAYALRNRGKEEARTARDTRRSAGWSGRSARGSPSARSHRTRSRSARR